MVLLGLYLVKTIETETSNTHKTENYKKILHKKSTPF